MPYAHGMSKYDPNIEPRQLHFQFPSEVPALWHDNSAIKTYYFNALALFLPTLERLVVLSLKKTQSSLLPTPLKMQVASLIAQEAIHGREFNVYRKAIVSKYYLVDPKHYELKIFRGLSYFFNRLSPTFHTALSAAGEHLTAISGALFLKHPHWFEGMPPALSAIWRWHCIEEIEHKSVAFDVFKALNGNYLLRVIAMVMMLFVFFSVTFKPIWQMMKKDGNHKKFTFYFQAFQYYWGKNGLYRHLIKPCFAYFKPRFHPQQTDDSALIVHWKAYFKTHSKEDIVEKLQFTEI